MTDPKDRQAPDWLNELRDEVMTLEHRGSAWVLAEDYRALQQSIPALIAEAVEAAAQKADDKAKFFEMTASMGLPIMSGTVARDRAKVAREIAAAIRHQGEGDSK